MSRALLSIAITALSILNNIASPVQANYAGLVKEDFIKLSPRAGSRLLAENPKNGKHYCSSEESNVCHAETTGRKRNEQLSCCKNQCRDVLSDRNNCGCCGHKCSFGQLCCNGVCATVAYDVNNCGECGKVCRHKQRCEYGTCGYA
ncbi:protein GRIM REAPER-like [Dendrobium catenatum]|uniref:Pectate lyase n=1 Tax=Dendrobium catenatum TaxID=906689 RepID=A0A2I0VID6_9ASPA|nr:protein GRIM REAPER-like [Dendrobium catenatum]PKU63143.1 pectate lyase [Dendrobium catenatum]